MMFGLMKIAVPRERRPGERRVAATPETVRSLRQLGFDVAVESDAGVGAVVRRRRLRGQRRQISDRRPRSCGRSADIVLKVQPPDEYVDLGAHEADLMRPGTAC